MYTFKTHIKSSIFKNIFLKLKKTVNTFSIFKKFFSKNKNYCVLLEYTLTKSFK